MNTSAIKNEPRATELEFDADTFTVILADGRALRVPLTWFPRLFDAKEGDREKYELIGDGEGISWPLLDEDISVAGLLRGEKSFEAGVLRPGAK